MTLCYICHEEIIKNNQILECNHEFHLECVSQIRKLECPICRTHITSLSSPIIRKIKNRMEIDKKRRDLEDELATTLLQIQFMEEIAKSITITVSKSL